jgi:hypothetical protein
LGQYHLSEAVNTSRVETVEHELLSCQEGNEGGMLNSSVRPSADEQNAGVRTQDKEGATGKVEL